MTAREVLTYACFVFLPAAGHRGGESGGHRRGGAPQKDDQEAQEGPRLRRPGHARLQQRARRRARQGRRREEGEEARPAARREALAQPHVPHQEDEEDRSLLLLPQRGLSASPSQPSSVLRLFTSIAPPDGLC